MKLKPILIFFLFISTALRGQDNSKLFDRLQALTNNGIDFMNVDGIEITSQYVDQKFSKASIAKKFKRYNIKESDLANSDDSIGKPNYVTSNSIEISPGITQTYTYYFIESDAKKIIAVGFGAVNKVDKELEHQVVSAVINRTIPKSAYQSLKKDTVNFAGRPLSLSNACRWAGINNMQCPYNGQMNWSLHKNLASASQSVETQYKVIKVKKGVQIVSEESVDIIFEGTETKAKKVVYDIKGVNSLLAGMSGGKTLTVYFVAVPVRKTFVSCVMSYWNNDVIGPDGLPLLLSNVMTLKTL